MLANTEPTLSRQSSRRPFYDARLEQLFILSPYWHAAGWGSPLSVELLAWAYTFLTQLYEDKTDFPKPNICVNTKADIVLSWGICELVLTKDVGSFHHQDWDYTLEHHWSQLFACGTEKAKVVSHVVPCEDDTGGEMSAVEGEEVLSKNMIKGQEDWRTQLPTWASESEMGQMYGFFLRCLSWISPHQTISAQMPAEKMWPENFQINQLDAVFHVWSQQVHILTARDWPQQVKTSGSPLLTSLSVTTAKQDWCCPTEVVFPFVYQTKTYKSCLKNVFQVNNHSTKAAVQQPMLTYEIVLPHPCAPPPPLTIKGHKAIPQWVQLARKDVEQFAIFPSTLLFAKNFLQSDMRLMVLYDFTQEQCQLRFTCRDLQTPLLTICFEHMSTESSSFKWE